MTTKLDRRLLLLWDEDVPQPSWYDQWLEQAEADKKSSLISEALRTEDGRRRLAEAMVQPLRRRQDYTAVGRRTFLVEPLPDGALPIYDQSTTQE